MNWVSTGRGHHLVESPPRRQKDGDDPSVAFSEAARRARALQEQVAAALAMRAMQQPDDDPLRADDVAGLRLARRHSVASHDDRQPSNPSMYGARTGPMEEDTIMLHREDDDVDSPDVSTSGSDDDFSMAPSPFQSQAPILKPQPRRMEGRGPSRREATSGEMERQRAVMQRELAAAASDALNAGVAPDASMAAARLAQRYPDLGWQNGRPSSQHQPAESTQHKAMTAMNPNPSPATQSVPQSAWPQTGGVGFVASRRFTDPSGLLPAAPQDPKSVPAPLTNVAPPASAAWTPSQYCRCPYCGVWAPQWHYCAAHARDLGAAQPQEAFDDRRDADRNQRRPSPIPLDGDTIYAYMPRAMEPRMLRLTAPREDTAPRPWASSPGKLGSIGERPAVTRARQLLSSVRNRAAFPEQRPQALDASRSTSASPTRSPALQSSMSRSVLDQSRTSSPATDRRVLRGSSGLPGSVNVGRSQRLVQQPQQHQRAGAAAASGRPSHGRRCVWCHGDESAEHDMRCSYRRVVCKRCHQSVLAKDQAGHKSSCRAPLS